MPGTAAPQYRLLSDVDGKITRVFLALPADDPEAVPPLLRCIRAVVDALGPDVRYTVLHHREHTADVRALAPDVPIDLLTWTKPRTLRIDAGRVRLRDGTIQAGRLPAWGDYTPWVQDAFAVASTSDGPVLLGSPRVERSDGSLDEDVAPLLASHLGWRCETLPCALAASNILTDGRRVLLGARVVADNRREAVTELVGALAGTGGVAVLPRGEPQPVPHQDMYITLAGTTAGSGTARAVVGSQRMAARALDTSFEPDDTERLLDTVGADLEAQGYPVTRIPLLRRRGGARPAWISYNNVLVEADDGDRPAVRRVTMPAYAADGPADYGALDRAAADVWERLGFVVRLVEGPFSWLATHEGGLRCMIKVLARG